MRSPRIRPRTVSTCSPGAMTSTVWELRTWARDSEAGGGAGAGAGVEGGGTSGPRAAPVSTGGGAACACARAAPVTSSVSATRSAGS
ncbi:hypothetical protein NR798_01525 [Archangium gephyra]|uniref:hypothetical protein n=1 Tax=Archangium gephyra TaxID=48 RepID=UPI0035D4BFB3